MGKAIEVWKADLLHFDPQPILQPLRGQMTVAPDFAGVAVLRLLPAKQDWDIAEAEKTIKDFAWLEAGEYFAIQSEVTLWRDRFEPRARFKFPKPLVAAFAPRKAPTYTD
jgi:hypothetical protein